MLLCAAGDIHGAIGRLYDDVLAFESALGSRFEWVLHVGDFGVWPDPDRVDKATRKHEGAGDFPSWFAERRAMPRKTIFVKGTTRTSCGSTPWIAKSRRRGAPAGDPG